MLSPHEANTTTGDVMFLRSIFRPIRQLDPPGQPVAGEQVVDDLPELLLGHQVEPAPPALEVEEALRLGVDPGVEVVGLLPERVGRVEVLEVLNEPGAVDDPAAQVGQEVPRPGAAEDPAVVAHRVLAIGPRPVGEGCADERDGAGQLGPDCGQPRHRPAGLAVADDEGLVVGPGVPADDLLEEPGLGLPDVHQGLARDRLRVEPDEVDRVAGAEGEADLGIELEASDPGPLAGPGVDHHDGALRRVDGDALRGPDRHQRVVARAVQGPAVDEHVVIEDQHRRLAPLGVLQEGVAMLAQHVPEQDGALDRVHQVLRPGLRQCELGQSRDLDAVCRSHVSSPRRSRSVPAPALGFEKKKATSRTCKCMTRPP